MEQRLSRFVLAPWGRGFDPGSLRYEWRPRILEVRMHPEHWYWQMNHETWRTRLQQLIASYKTCTFSPCIILKIYSRVVLTTRIGFLQFEHARRMLDIVGVFKLPTVVSLRILFFSLIDRIVSLQNLTFCLLGDSPFSQRKEVVEYVIFLASRKEESEQKDSCMS